MRTRTFVIAGLALVVGGSLWTFTLLDPIWALLLMALIVVFIVVDRENKPTPPLSGQQGDCSRRKVLRAILEWILIGLVWIAIADILLTIVSLH